MINAAKPSVRGKGFKAYFMLGSREFYISDSSTGFGSWPGRYEQAAADLNRYLIKRELGTDVNDRIYFASFANSQEEFVSYLNLFFNLKFESIPQTT